MTPSEATVFEKGKIYKASVLFVSRRTPFYINVRMEDGSCFKVEVSGTPAIDVRKLKDKAVDLVCTEETDKGPEFALAPRYYAPPAPVAPMASAPAPRAATPAPKAATPARPRPTRGGQTGLVESLTLELKSSLVFSPTTHQPDSDQPFEIAKEIAALMNTAGGDLYLGVNDKGFVTGIENDLPHLGEAPIMMDRVLDENFDYKPDFDHFTTKLTTAVRCYLGTAAAALVGQPEIIQDPSGSGLRFVRVPVKPSSDVVYLGREESVVYRAQTSVLYLKGRQRELYVKARFYDKSAADISVSNREALLAKVEEQAEMMRAQASQIADMKTEIQDMLKAGVPVAAQPAAPTKKPATVLGKKVVVADNTSVPLEAHYINALNGHFGGLVHDGKIVGGRATNWADLFVELVCELATVDPVKFKALPDEPSFKGRGSRPIFARKGGRTHLRDASGYLGPDKDIRVDRRDGTKGAFLIDPATKKPGLALRLITHFGLKPEQFRIWTGKQ